MNQIIEYIHVHRKWEVAALIGVGGILTYAFGPNSIWVIVVTTALGALGVNYIPNKQPAATVAALRLEVGEPSPQEPPATK